MTQIKINYSYEVILLLLKKEMHQRGLVKELETSLTRIQSILKELRNINVVDYKEIGKNHIYFIKKNLISKLLISNAENYKLIKLIRKHVFLGPLFEDILKAYPHEMILLFGSYAKGTETKKSDLDLYIDTTNRKIKETVQSMSSLISVKIGKFNLNDLLIKEIIKNHVIINRGNKYYEKIKFFS